MAALARVVEPPRSRALLKWSLRLAAIAAAGFGVKALATRSAPVQAPASPPSPVAPILAPLAAPQLVVVPAPVPPPPPVVEEPDPPPPRALSPVIRAECVTQAYPDSESQPYHCAWDTGFPAISADGTTIATAFIPIDDGRGNPGLTIRLVDAATGKTLSSVLVLSPDEYVVSDDPKRAAFDKKIERRVEKAQGLLAGYRAMIKLGTQDADPLPQDGMRAELEDGAVRLIDTAKNLAVWQRTFDVAKEFPNRKLDGEHCEPIYAQGISVAWDPPTRIVVASVNYLSGPEFCGNDVQRDYVARVKP